MNFKDFINGHPTKYKWFMRDIHAVCEHKGIKVTKAGSVGPDNVTVCRLDINPDAKRTIGIVAGIHGDEIAGPLGLLSFLQDTNPKDFKETRIVAIPVANPTGFDMHKRWNWQRRDPNRGFCEAGHCEESEIIKKVFSNEKMDLFVTLHEHPQTNEFYFYYSDLASKPTLEKLVDMARKYFPIRKYQPVGGEKVKDGLVPHVHHTVNDSRAGRCTMENFMLKKGVHYLTTETPGKADLAKRIKYMNELLRFLVRPG